MELARSESGTEPQTLAKLISGLKSEDPSRRDVALRAARLKMEERASPEWVAGQVKTLLSFYFREGVDERVLAEQARIWIENLSQFPQQVVSEACQEWISNQTRRPTPAHIVELCRKHRARVTDHFPKPGDPPPPQRISPQRAAEILGQFRGIKKSPGAG